MISCWESFLLRLSCSCCQKRGGGSRWVANGCLRLLLSLASRSFSSFTADFGEQQMVFLFAQPNNSVVSALPKQVKERYGAMQVPGHSGRGSAFSVVVVVVVVVGGALVTGGDRVACGRKDCCGGGGVLLLLLSIGPNIPRRGSREVTVCAVL